MANKWVKGLGIAGGLTALAAGAYMLFGGKKGNQTDEDQIDETEYEVEGEVTDSDEE